MENTDQRFDLEEKLPTFTERPGGVLRHECKAWLPQGILGPKARGFVNDHAVQLFEATHNKVRFRIGRRRLLPRWLSGAHIPLELTVSLSPIKDMPGAMRAVTADIRPLGRFISSERFQQRSIQLIRALRYSLMAEDLVEPPGKYVFDDEATAATR